MTKTSFLISLNEKLSGLPKRDIEDQLNYYCEMIEDRMEEGMPEEDAVSSVGSIDDISCQIRSEFTQVAPSKVEGRRLKVWEIILIAVGSPVWLSLLIALAAILFSVFAVAWALVISLWAVFASVAACSVCGFIAGVIFAFTDNPLSGIALIAVGTTCAGLTIILFIGSKAATVGMILLSKKTAECIRNIFANKGAAQ